jgi:hypothetical protein
MTDHDTIAAVLIPTRAAIDKTKARQPIATSQQFGLKVRAPCGADKAGGPAMRGEPDIIHQTRSRRGTFILRDSRKIELIRTHDIS